MRPPFFRMRTDRYRMKHIDKDIIPELLTWIGTAVACAVVGILLSGCSPKTAPAVVTETHTTLNTDSLSHLIKMMMFGQSSQREKETVYVLDKTTYTVNGNGDTVCRERDRVTDRSHEWESKESRYLHVIDSLRQAKSRVDSIDRPVPYPVEVPFEVEKPLAWWQAALMWWGVIASVAAGILIYRLGMG